MHVRNPPWLWNPGQRSTEVQKKGISGPTKRAYVLQEFFKKKKKTIVKCWPQCEESFCQVIQDVWLEGNPLSTNRKHGMTAIHHFTWKPQTVLLWLFSELFLFSIFVNNSSFAETLISLIWTSSDAFNVMVDLKLASASFPTHTHPCIMFSKEISPLPGLTALLFGHVQKTVGRVKS